MSQTPVQKDEKNQLKRIAKCLYRRYDKIYARVVTDGKREYLSTGTNNPKSAREWLAEYRHSVWAERCNMETKTVLLHREQITVGQLIDAYVQQGYPTRKMHRKSPRTIENEAKFLKPIRQFFGDKPAVRLSLKACDEYLAWRTSGGYKTERTLRNGSSKPCRTKGGNRIVDLELGVLTNVLHLAVRHEKLKKNPLLGIGRYTSAHEITHCREHAPTADELCSIVQWLRSRNEHHIADFCCFAAYSGVRIGEALATDWESVDWINELVHIRREKFGVNPWVKMNRELKELLSEMKQRTTSPLLFPSPFNPEVVMDDSNIRRRLTAACAALGLRHVTPHGLRSYFVTQCREGGMSDAEIAALIGDKSGAAIIALVYGDVRPDHLFKKLSQVNLRGRKRTDTTSAGTVPNCIPSAYDSSEGSDDGSEGSKELRSVTNSHEQTK